MVTTKQNCLVYIKDKAKGIKAYTTKKKKKTSCDKGRSQEEERNEARKQLKIFTSDTVWS